MIRALLHKIDLASRRVTAELLSSMTRTRDTAQMAAWIDSRPPARQYLIIATTLGALLAAALVMAQFGWVGMAVYFALVVVLIR